MTDDELLQLWRSVSGPHAGLTGPLICFAAKIEKPLLATIEEQKSAEDDWIRIATKNSEDGLARQATLLEEPLLTALKEIAGLEMSILSTGLAARQIAKDAIAKAEEAQDALRTAATYLANEVAGILGIGIQDSIGTTNVRCLTRRLDELRAVLLSSPAKLSEQEDFARGGTTGDPQASRTASKGEG